MKIQTRGLTIAEAVVTLALVVFVFNLTAGLLQSYLRTMNFASGVDKTMEVVQTALNQVRKEVAQGVAFTSPNPSGGSTSSLTFSKIWTDSPDRLPGPDASVPLTWEPHDPTWADTVSYTIANERLLRTSKLENTKFVVTADQVSDFQVEFLANGNLSVKISVRQDKIVRTRSSEIFVGLMR